MFELTSILVKILIFIISAIPLYIAVKFLGGKTTILRTAIIAFLSGIAVSLIQEFFKTFGAIIAFIFLIWVYHEAFKLKWWKAFVAWFLQFIVIGLLMAFAIFVLALIGISVASFLIL